MKSVFFLFILLNVFPMILVADAGSPPIERLPLSDIIVLGTDGESVVNLGEQATVEVGYTVNYPNLEYVILFLITDEDNKVVSLSWIEGFQDELTDRPGSYICGDDICFDKHASLESHVCGDEICQNYNTYNSKSVQTSWHPSESGTYEITAFAWEGVDNPTAYSPPRSVEVTVVENDSALDPPVEPDTGEFRYGKQECHYTDTNGEQNFCVVEGWTKPASELDCEKICAPPGTKK